MFRTRSGSFRDFTCFSAFLVFFTSLTQPGFGQQPSPAVALPPSRSADPPVPGRVAPPQELRASAASPFAAPSPSARLPRTYQAPPAPRTTSADPTDPYIVAQAAALGNSAANIFAFVRDKVAFESYRGSLRGARGTLWSMAGNTLDRSSLLVALLRASGLNARYVAGTLSNDLFNQLLNTLAPSALRVLGCIGGGVPTAGLPEFNGQYEAESLTHYWVEFNSGSGAFTTADTAFPTAQLGQAIGTATSNFTDVPDNLQNTIRFRLNAEMFSQAAAQFGLGTGTTTVLDQTFNTSDLVGKPVTIGHFVNTLSPQGPVFGANTYTYSPYLMVGASTTNIDNDQVFQGTDYQETFTNFPLGSTILTGLTLQMNLVVPDVTTTEYDKTLFDRIGYANRRNGAAVQLPASAGLQPSIGQLDLTTINVLPNRQSTDALTAEEGLLQSIGTQLQTLDPQVQQIDTNSLNPPTADQQVLLDRVIKLTTQGVIAMSRMETAAYARFSDVSTDSLSTGAYLKAYFDSPRLVAMTSRQATDSSGTTTTKFELDVLKNDIRAVAPAGQSTRAPFYFNYGRGIIGNALERATIDILASVPQPSGSTFQTGVTTAEIFQAAQQQGIPGITLTAQNVHRVETLAISADAKARITDAIARQQTVIVPAAAVTVNGQPVIGWYEQDPTTGYTTGVLEDGSHALGVELGGLYKAIGNFYAQLKENYSPAQRFVIGLVFGITIAGLITETEAIVKGMTNLKGKLAPLVASALNYIYSAATGALDGFTTWGLATGGFIVQVFLVMNDFDPPAPPVLVTLPPLNTTPTPGSTPGVSAAITPDTLFTVPFGVPTFNQAPIPPPDQIQSAFRVQITNTGPAADTFRISPLTIPPGFTLGGSLSSIAIPAGQTAEVNVCYFPTGNAPAQGTQTPFSVFVSSATNPNVTTTVNSTFTIPQVQAVSLGFDAASLTLAPGGTATANLAITGSGNVSTTAALSLALPPGVTASGLLSPVTVSAGQVIAQQITFSAPSNVTVLPLPATATATWGSGGALTTSARIGINIAATTAKCASDAIPLANQLGRTGLSNDLSDISDTITALSVNPSDAAQKARLIGLLNDMIGFQLNAPYIAGLTSQFQSVLTTITNAAPAAIPAALNTLSGILCSLSSTLSSAQSNSFNVWINPSAQVSLPQASNTFTVFLQNLSPLNRVFNVSLAGLPAGVTGSLNVSQISLLPSQTASSGFGAPLLTATITPNPNNLTPFTFTVTAAPADSPSAARTTSGSLTPRTAIITVDSVAVSPGFVDPGGKVTVTARLFDAVNQVQNQPVTLQVIDKNGKIVRGLFFSFDFDLSVSLSPTTTIVNVTLPQVDTTGFAPGVYTAQVFAGAEGDIRGGTYLSVSSAAFFVGPPISATLTANPTTLPPGNGTVLTTLTLGHDTVSTPVGTLVGATLPPDNSRAFALNGNTVFYCADKSITSVDASNPANPTILTTFGGSELGPTGFNGVSCAMLNPTTLVVTYSRENGNTTTAAIPTHVAVYNVSNPSSPSLLGVNNSILHSDAGGLQIAGAKGFLVSQEIVYNAFSFFIFQQFGDFFALDLSTPTNPVFVGDLFPPPGGDPNRGGPSRVFASAPVNPNVTLLPSTTSTGGDTLGPSATVQGDLLVVDTSNAASMTILKHVKIPEASFLHSIAIQGNIALVGGDTAGVYDANSGFTGTLTLTTLDISNPTNPVVLKTIVTQLSDKNSASAVSLGNNTFALGGAQNGTQPVLLLVDITDPTNFRYVPYNIPLLAFPTIANGTQFYTIGPGGLSIYRLDKVAGPQFTAKVNVPNGTGVSVNTSSFSLAPSQIVNGSTQTTYIWNQPTPTTITWNTNVTGLTAGNLTTIALGGEVDFTLPSVGTGVLAINPLALVTDQIISMTPAAQSVQNAGDAASYTVTLKNPTNSPVIYSLTVEGLPKSWVTLPASVNVGAQGSANVTLTLASDLNAAANVSYSFSVLASGNLSGVSGSVFGTFYFGSPVSPGSDQLQRSYSETIAVSPAQATAGQQTSAQYTVTVTNTGAETDIVSFSTDLSFNWNFSPASVTVAPGVNNVQQTLLTVTPGRNTPTGAVPFNIRGTSNQTGKVYSVAATVNVVGNGVFLSLNPSAGPPGTSFQLGVTNTGNVSDTFDLTLGGFLGTFGTLGSAAATVAAGATVQVPITFGTINFSLPGQKSFVAFAKSRGNTAVTANTTGFVSIPSSKGVTAIITPSTTAAPAAPGTATLLLQATNSGNTQDSYMAAITKTTGPVTASLIGTDGNPTQTISLLTLPGLAEAEYGLHAGLTGQGPGSVTVTVTSLSDPTVTSSATAVINSGGAPAAPIANAGGNHNVLVGATATLDGSASSDPNVPPLSLTYSWTLVTAPAGSTITTAKLSNPTAAKASFTPDVAGAYTFQLTVNNGSSSATANVTITATTTAPTIIAPIAKASAQATVGIGTTVLLDGSASSDPNVPPLALTYLWTLVSKPTGSAVTSGSILSPTAATASVVLDIAGAYTFQVQVSNGTLSATAPVTVTAVSGPVANAGKNRNVPVGRYAFLDGSLSYDPAGSVLTFQWTLLQAPAASQPSASRPLSPGSPRPVFLPDVAGAYLFQLVVSNGPASSPPSQVTITAFSGNVPPNANAGKPANVQRGATVTLDGSASGDPDNGPQPLQYAWSVQQAPAGSKVTTGSIGTANQPKASFVPDLVGTFVLGLNVSDGLSANFDTVTITASDPDVPPTAVAGKDQRVLPGAAVTLDGSGSFDPDDAVLSYQWKFVFTQASGVTLQSANTVKPAFAPAVPGFYVTRLQASDKIASSFDNVTVMVANQCDANADGVVNQVDFDLIGQLAGTRALPGDPLDANGDGVIDANDVAACQPAPPTLPTISVDQKTLVFNYVLGDPAPAAQTLHVTGSGAVIPFQVSTNGTPWLVASPLTGNTDAVVQVRLDASTLTAAGNVAALLTITPQRAANPGALSVSIVLHVLEPPRLTLTPSVLTFQYQQGGKLPAVQTVNVGSVTRGLAFTGTTAAKWIQVTPASGQTTLPVSIGVVNLDGFQAGTYKDTVTFSATNGAPQLVQVNLVVLPSPPVVTAAGVTNAASNLSGPIAAGEMLIVSGLYFGPAQLVKYSTVGVVATSLADTEIRFDGVPSPMLWVQAGKAEVVAPFFLDGRTTTNLQVVYQGVVSANVPLAVAKTAPGIFTADGTGTGQAMVVGDGTRGTSLSFFLTGGGVLIPPGFDGRIAAAPLAKLAQPVSVQIGGQTLQAALAGDADGMVEGFVKVDVTVPQNVAPGPAGLSVTIGGASSQPLVTITVK